MSVNTEDALAHLRAKVARAQSALTSAVEGMCPGPHVLVQNRDRRPPWCKACRRDGAGHLMLAQGDDDRPHSRACGTRAHDHGPACHSNCPTCGSPTASEDGARLFLASLKQTNQPPEVLAVIAKIEAEMAARPAPVTTEGNRS